MSKITKGVLIGLLVITACKKEEKDISKGDTEGFLYGVGTTSQSTQNSEGFIAINDFIADPPPGAMPLLASKSAFTNIKVFMNKILDWNDSVKCLYGTWTHTDIWKYDTNACGYEFYSNWDYVHNDTTGITFIWKYMSDTIHTANMRLYNILFVHDTLLASLSCDLQSDNNPVMNADFDADYDAQQKATRVHFRIEFTDAGEYSIDIAAAPGYNLEDTIFIGTVSGYVKDYTQNNYILNYYFENNEDSSMVFEFWDSDEWKFHLALESPVHTSHPPYDPHYYHPISGEITKNGKTAASLKGEIWVTEPPNDPEHYTWIHVVFPNGDEENLFKYIPAGSFILALLK